MRLLVLLTLSLLASCSMAFAQDVSCFPHCHQCRVAVAELKSGRVLQSIEFSPLTGEEELTSKSFKLRATALFVTASVFYTDESMASTAGADSMRLGVAVSTRVWPQAFAAPNNAVAEITLNTFDTAQVYTNVYAHGKRLLVLMECNDSSSHTKPDVGNMSRDVESVAGKKKS